MDIEAFEKAEMPKRRNRRRGRAWSQTERSRFMLAATSDRWMPARSKQVQPKPPPGAAATCTTVSWSLVSTGGVTTLQLPSACGRQGRRQLAGGGGCGGAQDEGTVAACGRRGRWRHAGGGHSGDGRGGAAQVSRDL